MNRIQSVLLACVFFIGATLTAGDARANTIRTFDASGTFELCCFDQGFAPIIAWSSPGALTVDVTTGTVIDVNFTVPGFEPFTTISNSIPFGGWFLAVSNSTLALFEMFLVADFTLIDYNGGLIQNAQIRFNHFTCVYPGGLCAGSGIVTPQDPVTPVPVPGALPLFGSALAAMGIFRWLRRRRLASAQDLREAK
jgi:hypothetical protein